MSLLPVLQIIHVSDLHVKNISTNNPRKAGTERRFFARILQKMIEDLDLPIWNQGTHGHYQHAPNRFLSFLQEWMNSDERWYGGLNEGGFAQTWMVDTGDLTTFGDQESMILGKQWLDKWCSELGNIRLLSLYGNHDAWPETHPLIALLSLLGDEIETQRDRVLAYPGWQSEVWPNTAISITIPGYNGSQDGKSRIELYAMDTVCWNPTLNALALGNISNGHLKKFRNHLHAQWTKDKVRNFRILATHHPFFYPYHRGESRRQPLPIPTNILLSSPSLIEELKNDDDNKNSLGPLVHLFLSGHTHAAYPIGKLPQCVTKIKQGNLAPIQLQLVNGPLMLNISDQESEIKKPPKMVDSSNCQAKILRFYSDTEQPGQLIMFLIPVWSEDGSEYRVDQPSHVRWPYDTTNLV